MPDLKLIKNPGYVYDLMFLFYYKYNADILPEVFHASEENMQWFSEEMKIFEPISDDLYIFFRVLPSKRCFFTINYFDNYSSAFKIDYDLAFLQKKISNYDLFIRNVINHYFENLDIDQINECMRSNKYIFDVIKKSDYDDKLKAKLYEFFIDPESYIHLLQYELIAKDIQLSSYYEKNYSKILDAYNELNFELLQERTEFIIKDIFYKTDPVNTCLSFCLLNKNLIRFSNHQDGIIYLLGVDYLSSIEVSRKKYITPDLEQFGSALADATRVKMLNIILQKGRCTRKELETELGIPASTAYHHVSILEKSGLVWANIAKKTQVYSIDSGYFSVVIDYLKRFLEQSEKQ